MFNKRLLAAALSLVMIFSMSIGAVASFSDTEGHWAKDVIEKWSAKGVIKGYDGKFNPNDSIKRGDMAVILDRVLSYDTEGENIFTDLDDNAYYKSAILKLNAKGIIKGADGKVRPDDYITREEAFVMINRIYGFEGGNESVAFSDEGEISSWAKEAVMALCANGIVKGADGKINPKKNITRAEIVQILENISVAEGGLENAGSAIGEGDEYAGGIW